MLEGSILVLNSIELGGVVFFFLTCYLIVVFLFVWLGFFVVVFKVRLKINSWAVSYKVKGTLLTYDPAIPFPGTYPREMKSSVHTNVWA